MNSRVFTLIPRVRTLARILSIQQPELDVASDISQDAFESLAWVVNQAHDKKPHQYRSPHLESYVKYQFIMPTPASDGSPLLFSGKVFVY